MTQNPQKIRPLLVLHLLAMLALAVWWGAYFWRHTPSRQLFRLSEPTTRQTTTAARRPALMPKTAYLTTSQTTRMAVALRAATGDLIFGSFVLAMVGIASGVYVRRLDNFLGARTSGQAVAFRGQDLTAAALDANQKIRGVLR